MKRQKPPTLAKATTPPKNPTQTKLAQFFIAKSSSKPQKDVVSDDSDVVFQEIKRPKPEPEDIPVINPTKESQKEVSSAPQHANGGSSKAVPVKATPRARPKAQKRALPESGSSSEVSTSDSSVQSGGSSSSDEPSGVSSEESSGRKRRSKNKNKKQVRESGARPKAKAKAKAKLAAKPSPAGSPPRSEDSSLSLAEQQAPPARGEPAQLPETVFQKNPDAASQLGRGLLRVEKRREQRGGETVYQLTGKGVKYTPLEQQVIRLKAEHPDVVLFVEVGYKFQFFGRDAEIASKVLNIFSVFHNAFLSASIPVHRLHVHLRRVVDAGYKVGVVRQTETAALKKIGDKANTVFERKLTQMYTRATMIDLDPISVDCPTSYLLCLYEKTASHGQLGANFAMLDSHPYCFSFPPDAEALHLASGALLWDEWSDDSLRAELAARLQHLQPAELLLPALSRPTQDTITAYANEHQARLEYIDQEAWSEQRAGAVIESFYSALPAAQAQLQAARLAPAVRTCLGVAITYLQDFQDLSRALHLTGTMQAYRPSQYMSLNGPTLKNLNVFAGESSKFQILLILSSKLSQKSKQAHLTRIPHPRARSLFTHLDHCATGFGSRLLRRWLMQPLTDPAAIEERQALVGLVRQSEDETLRRLIALLQTVPDLERGLARAQYKTCHPSELISILDAFRSLGLLLAEHRHPLTPLLDRLLARLQPPQLLTIVEDALADVNRDAASEDDVTNALQSTHFPRLAELRGTMDSIKARLDALRPEIAAAVKLKSFVYTHMAQERYLVELPKAAKVPASWAIVSKTAAVARYRSPEMQEQLTLMAQTAERLQAEAAAAWSAFLDQLGAHHAHLHAGVQLLASLDCCSAFARLWGPDYVMPRILPATAPAQLRIVAGRHPLVEAGSDSAYVPNDTTLEATGERCLMITGPNMGGKSSYIRHIATIALMAQLGAPVPAQAAELTPLDAIFTRMGASDNINRGESTFFIELNETAQILRQRTDRSLIILDELGRGTSTHDGVAIAYSVLRHLLLETASLVLFVTHYQNLAHAVSSPHFANFHMAFVEMEDPAQPGQQQVVFLYTATRGAAKNSYGLNVARLAGLPATLLAEAAQAAARLRRQVGAAEAAGRLRQLLGLAAPTPATLQQLQRQIPDD